MKNQIFILNILAFFFALETFFSRGLMQVVGGALALGLCAGALIFASASQVDENNNPVPSDGYPPE